MARKLVELGVDILEAGFPIASEGDFEAVDAVSREFPWAQVAALARCCTLDVERAAESPGARQTSAHSHLHRHQRRSISSTSSRRPSSRCWMKPWQPWNWPAAMSTTSSSPPKTARAPNPDFLEKISRAGGRGRRRTVNIPDTVGISTPKEYGALIGRIAHGAGRLRHRQRALP